jgi:hypothetical protein
MNGPNENKPTLHGCLKHGPLRAKDSRCCGRCDETTRLQQFLDYSPSLSKSTLRSLNNRLPQTNETWPQQHTFTNTFHGGLQNLGRNLLAHFFLIVVSSLTAPRAQARLSSTGCSTTGSWAWAITFSALPILALLHRFCRKVVQRTRVFG